MRILIIWAKNNLNRTFLLNILTYKFKLIHEHPRVTGPCPLAGDPIDERRKRITWSIKGATRSADVRICMELPKENSFIQTVLVADVLQPLDADIRDANLVRHEVGADEHLVSPAGRLSSEVWKDIRLSPIDLLVALRHGHDIAGLVARESVNNNPGVRATHIAVLVNFIEILSDYDIVDYPSRHCLSAFQHGLRQAVAVIEHYLFHKLPENSFR